MKKFFAKVSSQIKPAHIIILATVVLILGVVLGLRLFSKSDLIFSANTTIVPTKGVYAFKNTTNEFQTEFKARFTDLDSIVFKNDLGKISFYTPSSQSFGDINSSTSPVVDGSTLTYPAIFLGIDLKYTITSSRLLEEFIVQDATTAAQISHIEQRAQTKSTYVENDDGSITFYNQDKEVFTLPHPVMYETGNPGVKSEGIVYEIKSDGDQLIITKVITEEGQKWLADPKRLYPIAIDLVIDNADTSSNWTSSNSASTIVSQETTIKQEGTGSVKVQTTAGSAPVTVDLMEYSSDGTAQAGYVSSFASGGTITTSGAYRIHKFTASGTFTSLSTINVEVLVVAGGGGGGKSVVGWGGSGGGGAGGYLYNSSLAVTPQSYSVTVGGGGAGATSAGKGTNGGSSVFSTLTANGGGGGAGGGPGIGTGVGNGGGSGGGGAYSEYGYTYGGSGSQGNNGGDGLPVEWSPYNGGSGGGAGGAGINGNTVSPAVAIAGGAGVANSISGSSVTYSTGGGTNLATTHGAANTGNGGSGSYGGGDNGGNGGSGIVIIRYLAPLLSYSESMIRVQGTYALKGIANQTTSLNKTLTRTITSPLNLSDKPSVTFDIRASRTGSNIKIGLHDSGGTTTEVTPNITQADTFQSATIDLSGVTNANKDAIDQIIITIVNADATNTFYLDNMVAPTSLNNTVTRTTAATDLSTAANITYWVRSTVAGSYATFGFGESVATEQINTITIAQANTWEQKSWDISGIAAASRNAVTKYAFTFTGDTSGASFYFDDIQTNALFVPTLGTASPLSSTSIRWNFIDNSTEETGFKIYDSTGATVLVTCAGVNLTYCDETGLSPSTQYTRKIGTYNASFASIASGTVVGNTYAVALPGDYICTQDTINSGSFTDRYLDGNRPGENPTRYIIGLDSGTGTDNSAIFEARSCIMTLNSTDTLTVGSLSLTGGSIAIADGGVIKIGQPAWIIDADGDGYSADGKVYYGTQPAGGRRKNLATTLSVVDCGDNIYSTSNVCCTVATRYQDSDGDGYGNPSVSISACTTAGYVDNNTDCNDTGTNAVNVYVSTTCYVDSDNDDYGSVTSKSCTNNASCGSATWASGGAGTTAASGNFAANATDCNDSSASLYRSVAGYLDSDGDGYGAGAYTTCAGASGSYVASASDCYDANANAKPGSTYCGTTNRGDGSFDYNCSGGNTKCGNAYYNTQVITMYQNAWDRANSSCIEVANYNVTTTQVNCGQAGYTRGGLIYGGWIGYDILYDGVPSCCGQYCTGSNRYAPASYGTQACQ